MWCAARAMRRQDGIYASFKSSTSEPCPPCIHLKMRALSYCHLAILALSLLDTLVQSCGYPFQLQIATKEFLNELVRRFPERPPPYPGPVMSRILDLINGWKEGICVTSRYKDDFGNIRDMHRLLTFKGYSFRNSSRRHDIPAEATTVRDLSLV